MERTTLPKIAASNYLNSAPLTYSFYKGTQKQKCNFITDITPATCAEKLSTSEVDVALIPTIEYQRIPSLLIVPKVAVASKHSVHSVVLASKLPLNKISSIAIDRSSKSSAALIQILFEKFYKRKISFHLLENSLQQGLLCNDAVMIIGDNAMIFDRSQLYVYDLVEQWNEFTGLPFVFAFWAVRKSVANKLKEIDFVAALNEGLDNISILATQYSLKLNKSVSNLLNYLKSNICYELDQKNIEGLQTYYSLSAECKLVERVSELNWL